MIRFIVGRLVQMLVVIVLVTFMAFMLVNLLPGNIVESILGSSYTPQAAKVLSKELDLNQGVLIRYWHWLDGAVQGHLGNSLVTHLSVASTIGKTLGPTAELLIGSQIIAVLLAGIIALASVTSRHAWVDRLGTGISFLAASVPAFVSGLLLLNVFAVRLHWVSSIGWVPPDQGLGHNLSAIVLPCLTLSFLVFPTYMRVFRNELQAQLRSEYVLLARTKGISTTRLMLRHVARNSLFGLVTVSAFSIGALVAGAVIIEDIYSIPGIAVLLLNGITGRDSTIVVGCVAFLAIVIVLLNLVADLAYVALDPRVRSQRA
jgi:peptide/nickel transport system permease protein